MKIPLSYRPIDAAALNEAVGRVAETDHLTLVHLFEMELAKVLARPVEVVSTNSGTSAIHLALLALGVGPRDTVIAPTFTYIGSVAPIQYIGAKPVFIDCEADTWGMDPELLQQCLASMAEKKQIPKAVIVVDCYGMPAKWHEINNICRQYGVPTIEDAAAALGGSYHGEPCGTLADVGVFSFNSNKTITTFGGGALITRCAKLAERARFLSAFARDPMPYYHYSEVGFNYRMGPLNAAYGISQLPLIPQKVRERRLQFEAYRAALKREAVEFLNEPIGSFSSRWLTTVTFNNPYKVSDIQFIAKQREIEIRPVWHPMHKQVVFANEARWLNGFAEQFFEGGVCLPGTAEVETVAALLAGYKL